jgi:flagellar biosynthesis chaperone FliJ
LRFSSTNDEQIKRLQYKVSELESEQSRKIAEVLKVRQFKESLERLRAEAKSEFIKEQEKLEQKELDDGATVSFTRKMIQRSKIVNTTS